MFRVPVIVLFTLLLQLYSPVQAQQLLPLNEQQYYQQLNENLQQEKENSKRLQTYLLLSEYWLQKDTLKSKNALTAARSIGGNSPATSGTILYYEALYWNKLLEKSKAEKLFERAVFLLEKASDSITKRTLAQTWYNLAYLRFQSKGYDYMVDLLTNKCIPLASEINDLPLQAYYYTQLGLIFMSVGQLSKADEQHQKSLSILQGIPEEENVHLITYLNMVSNYCYMPDSKTAKIYLDKAAAILKKYPSSFHYVNYYYQEGMYYTTISNSTKALESLQKGVELAKEYQQIQSLQLLEFRIYNNYLVQKKYSEAKAVLENILREGILTAEVNNRKIVLTQLSIVDEAMGNFKEAYYWLKKSFALSDSIQAARLLEKMNELEIVHETAEKQKTINKLEQEKMQAELMDQNKNLRILILIVALGLVISISILIYFNYRNQRQLNEQIHINHQQKLNQISNDRKFEAAQAILQGEEQERQRVAQDLHDSMGGMLASIRMNLSTDSNSDKEILKKLDQAILEMRRISRNLMPETLKNLGLETALKELCDSMNHNHLAIQFEAYNLCRHVPFKTELALYRIVQECISNVLKHAQASTVIVQVSQNENSLQLTIEDDGIGYDQDSIVYGSGIKNIENRVQLINGLLEINSSKGEGTTINVECHV
jgi:two-component system NarL family sensor kinase